MGTLWDTALPLPELRVNTPYYQMEPRYTPLWANKGLGKPLRGDHTTGEGSIQLITFSITRLSKSTLAQLEYFNTYKTNDMKEQMKKVLQLLGKPASCIFSVPAPYYLISKFVF